MLKVANQSLDQLCNTKIKRIILHVMLTKEISNKTSNDTIYRGNFGGYNLLLLYQRNLSKKYNNKGIHQLN
jgi:hypothetical protein